jgi:alpha-ketoglutarate-dependent dioxygenase alkB family protein 2
MIQNVLNLILYKLIPGLNSKIHILKCLKDMNTQVLKLGPESEVLIVKGLFKNDDFFDILWKLIPDDSVKFSIAGKLIPAPRKIATYGQDYPFSGIKVEHEPWNKDILKILIEVCKTFHSLGSAVKISSPGFNMALLNWYRDGNDSIGDHRDDEKIVIPGSGICGVSFGATRKFVFKPYFPTLGIREIRSKCEEMTDGERLVFADYFTSNNDVFLFQGKTNKTHTHGIPKEPKIIDPRISITFRLFNTGPVFYSWIDCADYWENYLNKI